MPEIGFTSEVNKFVKFGGADLRIRLSDQRWHLMQNHVALVS